VSNVESWDRIAARTRSDPSLDAVRYGPDGPTEDDLRLLGDVADKRVLDLGCGAGGAAIVLARAGAAMIAVDSSTGQLERARRLAEREEVRIEWHHGDLADLAFLRADSIDLAFSGFVLAEVEDLSRLFRQVHRVLRPNCVFVFSYEHPLALCVGREPPESPTTPTHPVVLESYFGTDPIMVERDGEPIYVYRRRVAEVFAELGRAGFRTEVIVEPEPPRGPVPTTVVWRARKEGM
jgi:ubiquinone/menaquinone biosynthesis C-methylase UbiE